LDALHCAGLAGDFTAPLQAAVAGRQDLHYLALSLRKETMIWKKETRKDIFYCEVKF